MKKKCKNCRATKRKTKKHDHDEFEEEHEQRPIFFNPWNPQSEHEEPEQFNPWDRKKVRKYKRW